MTEASPGPQPEPAGSSTASVIRFPHRAAQIAEAKRRPPLTGRGRLYLVLGLACLLPSLSWFVYALVQEIAAGRAAQLIDFGLSAISLIGLPVLLGWVLLALGLRQRAYD